MLVDGPGMGNCGWEWTKLVFAGIEVKVTSVTLSTEVVVIRARGKGTDGVCPGCGHGSMRVHDRYLRRLRDVPLSGRRVEIELTVRRFVCGNADCEQHTFTEQLAGLTSPYGRCTLRLSELSGRIGLALAGRARARITAVLGIQAGRMTLLRRVMALPDPIWAPPRVLGVDDFATRRAHTYSTVLTDGQTHQVIDVLPTRRAEHARGLARRPPGCQGDLPGPGRRLRGRRGRRRAGRYPGR
ncbi:transposase family protein [Streptomyces sp. NPDC047525]|uniref:transposase family protein n=1 Tax=Streptomyces sp. NPDC047525 TaxID=3155264 RepID=UPI0033DAB222